MSEVPSKFRQTCRFFGGYSGSCGYTTIQIRPANSTSYVLLMQQSPLYHLPTEMGDLRPQFQGLVRLLQTRVAMRTTIELYKELQKTPAADDAEGIRELMDVRGTKSSTQIWL
ncbi:hypothetical protein BGX31_002229 [Mortierella sp. GBA43]|nr:hypothetical protein BGX31_002229 [Mortierella sp. GBA43]